MMQSQTAIQHDKPLLSPRAPAGEEARVDAVFSAVKQRLGFIPDALRIYSFSPTLLENFVGNISYFNSGERIAPRLMAMIRYLVSWESKCTFCIDMNEGMLTHMGLEPDDIRAARNNPELAPVSAREKILLNIALKSVNAPENVSDQDIQAAKSHGWTERDIFDAVVQATGNRALSSILRTFNIESQGAFA